MKLSELTISIQSQHRQLREYKGEWKSARSILSINLQSSLKLLSTHSPVHPRQASQSHRLTLEQRRRAESRRYDGPREEGISYCPNIFTSRIRSLHILPDRAASGGRLTLLLVIRASKCSQRRALADRSTDLTQYRTRTASASSTNLSIAPTVVHSHFHQSSGRTPPPPPPSQATVDHGLTPAESHILSNLWLMSAATFRRWGKLEQCLVSIQEAETLDPENADVWVQLGLYHISNIPPSYDIALPAFTKSILLRPGHPSVVVSLAKLYLSTGQVELAHSLLNQLTQDIGWDVPEAWYYLGKVCEAQERNERARECWVYALGLEESRPARRWADAVDRWL